MFHCAGYPLAPTEIRWKQVSTVAEGAKSAGGQTIGLLTGADKTDANAFIDVAIPFDLGIHVAKNGSTYIFMVNGGF